MALATVSRHVTSPQGSTIRAAEIAYNAMLDAHRVECVSLDADATVNGTDYTSLFDAATGVVKILDVNGNAIGAN